MNTPNKISLIRILLIPFVVFFFLATFIPYGKLIATFILVVAETTDFLDGYLARKNNQVTDLGKFLDPIADKVLIITALILVVSIGNVIPFLLGVLSLIIIVARELVISAFRQIASTKNIVMAADFWGKLKTFVQCFSLPMLFVLSYLIDNGLSNQQSIYAIISYVLLGIVTLLTIMSGLNYMIKNRAVLKN